MINTHTNNTKTNTPGKLKLKYRGGYINLHSISLQISIYWYKSRKLKVRISKTRVLNYLSGSAW